jgi:hypothetical protein
MIEPAMTVFPAIFAITWVAALVFWKRRGRIGTLA